MRNKKIFELGSLILVLFIIPFISANECPVGYICGGSSIEVSLAEGYFCPDPYTDWIDTSASPFGYFPTIGSGQLFDCRDPYTGPSCCPVYSTCQDIGVDTDSLPDYAGIEGYTCLASTKIHCSQFDESECEAESTISIAKQSIELNPDYGKGYCNKVINVWEPDSMICWNQTACQCIWNGTSCLAEARIETECDDEAGPTTLESCDYEIIYDDSLCNLPGGQINATWKLVAGDPLVECDEAGSFWIPCTEIMRLGFFTWINIIAVVVILIAIYYLYFLKKGKRKLLKKK